MTLPPSAELPFGIARAQPPPGADTVIGAPFRFQMFGLLRLWRLLLQCIHSSARTEWQRTTQTNRLYEKKIISPACRPRHRRNSLGRHSPALCPTEHQRCAGADTRSGGIENASRARQIEWSENRLAPCSASLWGPPGGRDQGCRYGDPGDQRGVKSRRRHALTQFRWSSSQSTKVRGPNAAGSRD